MEIGRKVFRHFMFHRYGGLCIWKTRVSQSHETRTIVELSISNETQGINLEIQGRELREEINIVLLIFSKIEFMEVWPTFIAHGHLRGSSSVELALMNLSVAKSIEERRHG
jgi:hypothetical protein